MLTPQRVGQRMGTPTAPKRVLIHPELYHIPWPYHYVGHLVGGLEHELYDFPFSWECHDPN